MRASEQARRAETPVTPRLEAGSKTVHATDMAVARERWRSRLQHPCMRHFPLLCSAIACTVALVPLTLSAAEDTSPIFGVRIPAGYRHWELIAPSHEAGGFNELRAILGNPIAVKAYQG